MLLRRALDDIRGTPTRVVALDARTEGPVPPLDALRFVARLTLAQLALPRSPVVFNHIGIARAERRLPGPLRRPYAVFLHGIEAWDAHMSSDAQATIRAAALRISNSVFTAERTARAHPDLGPIEACPLCLMPDIQSPTPDDQLAAAGIVPKGTRCVAIVGRMSSSERYKGHDELLEAWPGVLAAVPDAYLVVIGKGDDLARLTEKAKSLRLMSHVTFTGFLPDGVMRAVLSLCDVYAMPSRGEGFGLAYLEAMRAGLPCIGSDQDAAGEIIVDGTTGLLAADGSRESVGLAVIRLLSEQDLRRRMGAAGRRREIEVFSYGRFRERLNSLLWA
jgi:phosphatidylinositol alpha-1,6-mannosyltransferase